MVVSAGHLCRPMPFSILRFLLYKHAVGLLLYGITHSGLSLFVCMGTNRRGIDTEKERRVLIDLSLNQEGYTHPLCPSHGVNGA